MPTPRILAHFCLLTLFSLLPVQPLLSSTDLIADETGDNPANYVNASYGPGSAKPCNVVLRAVQAKTLTPIDHVQVAIDTQYDQNDPDPPEYNVSVRSDGSQSFIGGHVHDITKKVRAGAVSLGAPPPYFMLSVNTVEPGHSSDMGLVYRQCFAPTTTLLYVVKNYGESDESADYLWVKSGKYAIPAAH